MCCWKQKSHGEGCKSRVRKSQNWHSQNHSPNQATPSEAFCVPPPALCTRRLPPVALSPQDSGGYGVRLSPAPGLNSTRGRSVGLAGSDHMPTSWLQGSLGKQGSGFLGFLVEGWLSSPNMAHAMWNSPSTKGDSAPKSNTHPMPLMVSISPGFLLMVVVKLHPFPRTGEGGRATGPCQNSLACGPMSQVLSPRCQPNTKNVSRSWAAIQSTRPRLGWRAHIAG